MRELHQNRATYEGLDDWGGEKSCSKGTLPHYQAKNKGEEARMIGNTFNGITHFVKGKRSLCAILLAMIFLFTTSIAAYAVETPTGDPPAGTYGGKQNVELKTQTVTASVYYTTDGSVPTTASNLYTDLIEVASNMTIKAFAADGTVSSEVYAFEYIIFDGGSGTKEDPYLVATAEQLNNVRYHLDKHFKQTADIDLNVAPYNTGAGWEPVGSYLPYTPFTGTFDGNGKIISNLTIKRSTTNYVGLFGFARYSHIKNVKLEKVDVTDQDNVGGLVGYNENGMIINSYATGTVMGSKYVGGLVGQTFGGTITNSYAAATVNGTNQVGGLVGVNDNAMIINAYATGAVTAGTSTAGGLVGDNYGTITNSYATGAVTAGISTAGGLVGNNYGTITNSYATGAVTGKNAGGLVGINNQDDLVSNSYWDINTSGTNLSAGGEGITTDKMKLPETYEGWDFNDIWGIEGTRNNGYPFLLYNTVAAPSANPPAGTYIGMQNVTLATATEGATLHYTTDNSEPTSSSHQYTTAIEVSSNTIIKAIAVKDGMDNSPISTFEYLFFAGGSGTEADPYQIATPEQLDNVRKHLDKHFIQTADIDLNVAPYNKDSGWKPIRFDGTFDGNGKIISNLTINRSTEWGVGLFGSTGDTAKIKNVKLEKIDINGDRWVGGLVGSNNGTIDNSYAAGIVKSRNVVGGLVGLDNSGKITNSYVTGTVNGVTCVGGLVGGKFYGTITNSYAMCAVTGTTNVGGLVGDNQNGTLTCSYATGAVTGTTNVGGLVGQTPDVRFVSNSYWEINTSGTSLSAGGTGKTTEEMKLPGTYVGWDFTNTWGLEAGKNKGYPFLKDNTPPTAAAPSANLSAGTYIGTQNITLFTATEGATIYYTTDNSQPTTGSPQYTSTIEISSNTIIKAIAVKDGLDNSPVSTFEYVVIFAGGDGSVDNPYQIATPEQLDNMRNYLDKHFIQTADIDLNVAPYNANEGWKPIGEEGFDFNGTFNGNGKTISNLIIKRSSGWSVGLFGFTKNTSQIKNVKLRKIDVTGAYHVGGLVGYNDGTITNSYATGDVTGIDEVGGLVGHNKGSIANSYAAGIVKANLCAGGLVGQNVGTITDSYATANVTGIEKAGGLVGFNTGDKIINSYARGAVYGNGYVGGLVAINYNAENTKKSYWDINTSGTNSSAGGEGKITTDMKLQETYVDWDFTNVWNIDDSTNDGYPFLKNNPPYTTPATKYAITVANVVGGTATVTTNPATEAAAGETVTVSIDGIEPGKQFKSITVTNADSGAVETTAVTVGSSYTFTMLDKAVTVTVEVETISIVSATINPTTITFNKNLEAQADASTTINWNSATSVTAVKKGDTALKANTDYTVYSNTLTIKKEYLAAQAVGKAALTIEFDKGNAATLTITISDTTPLNPTITSITAVNNIEVAYGTTEATALAALAATTTITDSNTVTHRVSLSWSIASYDGNTPGNYTATGTFTLPAGVDQSDPQTELKVTAIVTVNAAVPAATYTLTITAATGGSITTGTSGNYLAGIDIAIAAKPASGYSFNKWTSTSGGTFANANNASTTYTMPANPATITATFTYNSSSGGSSGSNSGSSTTPSGSQVTPSGRTTSQNGVNLTFPAGAVESDIQVQMKAAALTTGMTLPDNSQLLSRVMDIVKDKSGNFLKPVTITLSFDNSGLDPNEYDIAIYYYDEDTGKWIALDNIRLNFNSGTISGDTNHFTKFAVIATPKTIKEEKPAKPVTPQPTVNIPSDISSHWAKDSIMKMINGGVISGYPDGTFKPDKAVTRAEFTVMIVKALKLETRAGKTFTDTTSHWAKDSIATAAAHGIISGYDENTFGPDDLITREQAAVIIARAAKLKAATDELNFTDSKSISPWAKPGVAAVFKGGFISGYPDGSFKPQGNTTRAEAAVIIGKLL